jgi:hypothetical protein
MTIQSLRHVVKGLIAGAVPMTMLLAPAGLHACVPAVLVRSGVPARAIVTETRDASHAVFTGYRYTRYVIMLFEEGPPRATAEPAGCS